MTKLEETIGTILDGIQSRLAESTLEYRREVFGQLTRMADEMGITEPCQKLYDAFAKDDRGSKQRQSMHLLIIKMLDAKTGTQGLTLGALDKSIFALIWTFNNDSVKCIPAIVFLKKDTSKQASCAPV